MRPTDEVTSWTLADMRRAIARREVSPVEVVEAHLERIADDTTNAVVTIADDALDRARAAEHAVMRDAPLGSLHGVPFTAKEVLDTGGLRTTAGSRLFRDCVPGRDAESVAALRRAGAILIGKTNCPEFALEPQTANPVFGTTHHPQDARLGPGGSSGGCAAAVAGGLTPLSLGTDYGGSVRFPAHCTGILGLRPTPGRIPAGGQRPAAPPGTPRDRFSLVGPLARTPLDLALALAALDPASTAPVPEPAVDTDLPACSWAGGEGTVPVRADIAEVVERAASLLSDAGYPMDAAAPTGLDRADPLFGELRATDDYADLAALAAGREDELTPRIRNLLAGAPAVPDRARRERLLLEVEELRATMLEFFRRSPILLLPVAVVPAFPVGSRELEVDGVRHVVDAMTILAPCRAISLLGLPALSVPAGLSRDGLPVGVQIVGRPGDDERLLGVARVLARSLAGAAGVHVRPTT
jgi:Asp-tRNA(Asn)/Glu-tRNA(Gln) amidotransferase A subunit family amidase